MSDLLPPNATELERIAAQVGAQATDLPVILRSLWDPEECPLELLPWLAWAWSADEWSTEWTERQMRDSVKASIDVQAIKGTIGAVKRALGALGLDIQVQEWFAQTPAAAPHTFRVLIETEQVAATRDSILRALAVIAATKPLRSHLSEVAISARSTARAHVAAVVCLGHEITVIGTRPVPVVINSLALVV